MIAPVQGTALSTVGTPSSVQRATVTTSRQITMSEEQTTTSYVETTVKETTSAGVWHGS